MRIIALYLPQFHNIPENDKWWGKGFTEWTNVKRAIPLFKGHEQPRIPLDGNYYNLLDDDVKIWQANIAKKYGIYGFCYYHYWFNGKKLLEKPMEQMIVNKKVDMPFCICWANEAWTKRWIGDGNTTLISQTNGGPKDWELHFNYLIKFFKDDRYIFIDNKPIIFIYRPELIDDIEEMLANWEYLAKKNGLEGICPVAPIKKINEHSYNTKLFKYLIEYQPSIALNKTISNHDEFNHNMIYSIKSIREKINRFIEKKFGRNFNEYDPIYLIKKLFGIHRKLPTIYNYEKIWKNVENKPMFYNSIPMSFVGWDNTPRFGNNGSLYFGQSIDTFKKYFDIQIKNIKNNYNTDYLFFFAWNEWAEGSYLEPDEKNEYGYLEAIRDVLVTNNEFPF